MADNTYWVLNFLNAHRREEEEITLENGRGRYLPKERLVMKDAPYADAVNKVLGEPTHLEKAEMMFLEIEEGKLTKEEKYSNIIDIAYSIADACNKELGLGNLIWEKYGGLDCYIPISTMERNDRNNWHFSILDFQQEDWSIPMNELEKMKTWLFLTEEAKENLPKKVFFEYIFELVHISLKKIFEEVKKEIMGE